MAEQLKHLYSKEYFNGLVDDIKRVYPAFDSKKYLSLIFYKGWEALALKERMHHSAVCFEKATELEYKKGIKILIDVVKKFRLKKRRGFGDIWFCDYAATYGMEYPEISFNALELFTQLTSAEFAIRPFYIKYPDLTLNKMLEWSKHKNTHVRRLSSEGSRPRLPWGMALQQFKKDPSPMLPILYNLRDDESEYVRKSVANNLNDISKDNPAVVLKIAKEWMNESENTRWIVKHALRTLLKKGNKEALKIFGYNTEHTFTIKDFSLSPLKIKPGEKLSFSFKLINNGKETDKARLEYNIYYVKSAGKLSKKVFQIGENDYEPGKEYLIKRSQSFQDFTTRKHFKGTHKLSISVNGVEDAALEFDVV